MKALLKTLLFIFVVAILIATLFNVRVKYIEVNGSTKQTEEEVIEKIFSNDFDRIALVCFIKNNLLSHKDIIHIEKYDVIWNTPFSIDINVYEKADIGYIKRDVRNVYFDKDGIISEISDERKSGIPEVRGINFYDFEKGTKLKLDNRLILDAILNITSRVRDYNLPLHLLEIDNSDNISVYIDNIKVDLGDIKNMEIKLQRLSDIYPQIKEMSGILDLRKASDNMLDEKYIFKKTA